MTDKTAGPPDTAGINAVRLDADRTRDELAGTLDEIESRLKPRELWNSITLTFQKRPVPFVGATVGAIGAIAGLIALSSRRRNNG